MENTPTVTTGLETIGTVVGQVWSWFGDCVSTANSHVIMWLPVGFGIAGATVGLLRRATRIGGRRR